MKMKRIVALLLAAMMMVAVFASCNGDASNTSTGSGSDSGDVSGQFVDPADFGDQIFG